MRIWMMGSLGGGGNVSFFLGAVMGDGRCNFSFLFSMGTRTASAGFLLEFFFSREVMFLYFGGTG
jgi:hypothetical protein